MLRYDIPEPIVTPTAYGKHIARAPPHAVFRIAVLADTSEAARAKFFSSYAAWRASFIPPSDYQI